MHHLLPPVLRTTRPRVHLSPSASLACVKGTRSRFHRHGGNARAGQPNPQRLPTLQKELARQETVNFRSVAICVGAPAANSATPSPWRALVARTCQSSDTQRRLQCQSDPRTSAPPRRRERQGSRHPNNAWSHPRPRRSRTRRLPDSSHGEARGSGGSMTVFWILVRARPGRVWRGRDGLQHTGL